MKFLILCIFALQTSANMLLTPQEILHAAFGDEAAISEKNIILKKEQKISIQKEAQTKLSSSIVRVYTVVKNEQKIAYGILLSNKIRSKNGVYLYTLNTKGVLISVEIVAFNEPLEYMPKKQWQEQFSNKNTSQHFNLSNNITPITGATLSARSITQSANLALAIYNQILK